MFDKSAYWYAAETIPTPISINARLIAKVYAQTHGVDYEETFALVEKMTMVWTVIALAAA